MQKAPPVLRRVLKFESDIICTFLGIFGDDIGYSILLRFQ